MAKNDTDNTPDASTDESAPQDGFTGIDGEAFPDTTETKVSEATTTQVSTDDVEFQLPKFVATYDENGVKLAPYGWVGPEALVVAKADLDDFKAFVASL